MRTIHIPNSSIPPAQVPDDSAVPDATAHGLSDVVAIVQGWH